MFKQATQTQPDCSWSVRVTDKFICKIYSNRIRICNQLFNFHDKLYALKKLAGAINIFITFSYCLFLNQLLPCRLQAVFKYTKTAVPRQGCSSWEVPCILYTPHEFPFRNSSVCGFPSNDTAFVSYQMSLRSKCVCFFFAVVSQPVNVLSPNERRAFFLPLYHTVPFWRFNIFRRNNFKPFPPLVPPRLSLLFPVFVCYFARIRVLSFCLIFVVRIELSVRIFPLLPELCAFSARFLAWRWCANIFCRSNTCGCAPWNMHGTEPAIRRGMKTLPNGQQSGRVWDSTRNEIKSSIHRPDIPQPWNVVYGEAASVNFIATLFLLPTGRWIRVPGVVEKHHLMLPIIGR